MVKLEHSQISYVIAEKQSCCGMPKLELGGLLGFKKHKDANIPVLARCARKGDAILSAVPSCMLMPKQATTSLRAWPRPARRQSHCFNRRRRSVHRGEHINLPFEDERTIRDQIRDQVREMRRTEKILEE